MGKLTIVGGVALDVILPNIRTLPNWPDHLEFTPHNLVLFRDAPILTIGGNGGNAAFVASCCGAKVTLHTALGQAAGMGLQGRGHQQDLAISLHQGRNALAHQRPFA